MKEDVQEKLMIPYGELDLKLFKKRLKWVMRPGAIFTQRYFFNLGKPGVDVEDPRPSLLRRKIVQFVRGDYS